MTKAGKRAVKRERHFDREQRKRAAVTKRIQKAEAGHDQWTGGQYRRALKQQRRDDT